MKKILTAAFLAGALALAACGSTGSIADTRSDPAVAETIEVMEAHGATDSEVGEMVAYASGMDEVELSDYLHLVNWSWEHRSPPVGA